MIETSALYKELLEAGGVFETHIRIDLGNSNYADFYDDSIFSVSTERDVFTSNNVSVGNCVSSRIRFQVLCPAVTIPEMAKVWLFVRVRADNRTSEWIPQGTFYIDTRKKEFISGVQKLTVTGFDGMMLAEKEMDYNSITFPQRTLHIVSMAATAMKVSLDTETVSELENTPYMISKPKDEYTFREMLEYIAVMYLGNFVVTKDNKLKLIKTFGDPSVLVDSDGAILLIGGDAILV